MGTSRHPFLNDQFDILNLKFEILLAGLCPAPIAGTARQVEKH